MPVIDARMPGGSAGHRRQWVARGNSRSRSGPRGADPPGHPGHGRGAGRPGRCRGTGDCRRHGARSSRVPGADQGFKSTSLALSGPPSTMVPVKSPWAGGKAIFLGRAAPGDAIALGGEERLEAPRAPVTMGNEEYVPRSYRANLLSDHRPARKAAMWNAICPAG